MWLIAVVLSMAASVVGHALVMRGWPHINRVMGFVGIGGTAGAALLAYLVTSHGLTGETAAALLAYAFACELYIFLFTLVMTSVSASLLMRLRRGELAQQEIDQIYHDDCMVEARLQRLTAIGLLGKQNDVYHVTERGARLSTLFSELRRFFCHPEP